MREYLSEQTYDWQVYVVSDGSTDGTAQQVTEFGTTDARFQLLTYAQNRGKGYAVRYGMLNVDADLLLLSDADLAAPIEEVEKLFPPLDKGMSIAIGSRPLAESKLEIRQPWYREFAGRRFNDLVQLLAIRGIKDTQCGFKLFKKEVADDVFSRCKLDGFSFDFEVLMIARDLGYGIAEIPIRWSHQEGSKVNFVRDGIRMIRDLVRLRMWGKKKRLEPNGDR